MSAVVKKLHTDNGEFKIEKGIPAPGPRSDRRKYPFWDMDVGDSFSFPAGIKGSVCAQASKLNKATDKHFVTRRQPDGSYRCWRTA